MTKKDKNEKGAKNKGKDKSRKDKARKQEELERTKVIRDSFTMPENDYAKIKALKNRYLQSGVSVKKGELLRAGLHALEQMDEQALLEILDNVERVKTGRPKQSEE